jgi:hypothetical protein
LGGKIMENNIETVEDVKIEGTGEKTNVATETKEEVKTITLEEAQKMVNSALAKKLPPKEEMDAFKQWKESQKTEADKQAETLKELETLRQEKLNTQRENALLKKGINVDDIDYVMFKVGKMDGEFDENLAEFLKENPKFTAKEEKSVASTTGVKTSGVDNKDSGVTAILKAKHPELFD